MNNMEILDKHFIRLPKKRKLFVFLIGGGYFLIGLITYISRLSNLSESLLIIAIGILFAELIKLAYRLESLEKKKKR